MLDLLSKLKIEKLEKIDDIEKVFDPIKYVNLQFQTLKMKKIE